MKNAATKFRPVSTLPSHSSALASSDRGALPPVVLFIWSLPKKLPGHEGPAFMSGTRRYFFEASFAVFRTRSRSAWESNLSLLRATHRSEEHTSELQSLMSLPYAVFCLTTTKTHT